MMIKNPVVVLTDVEYVGFIRKYWLAIVLNLLIIAVALVLSLGVCSSGEPPQATIFACVIILFLGVPIIGAILNGGILAEYGYWEHRME